MVPYLPLGLDSTLNAPLASNKGNSKLGLRACAAGYFHDGGKKKAKGFEDKLLTVKQ